MSLFLSLSSEKKCILSSLCFSSLFTVFLLLNLKPNMSLKPAVCSNISSSPTGRYSASRSLSRLTPGAGYPESSYMGISGTKDPLYYRFLINDGDSKCICAPLTVSGPLSVWNGSESQQCSS